MDIDAMHGSDTPKSAEEVLHEAHIASGCKPGESLIERCRELAAMAARLNAPLVVTRPTPESMARLRELAAKESCAPGTILSLPQPTTFFRSDAFIAAEEWCYVGADGKIHPVDGELQDGADQAVMEWQESMRVPLCGRQTRSAEEKTGTVTYEFMASHHPYARAEEFIGVLVMDAEKGVIGAIENAVNTSFGVKGTIRFNEGVSVSIGELARLRDHLPSLEPPPLTVKIEAVPECLLSGEPDANNYAAAKVAEPKQETWRDRPSML